MIFVHGKERTERFNACQACEHYQAKHRSCGTYLPTKIMGGELQGDLVEVEGRQRKVRLCGCDMAMKTKFKAASCPIGKWGSLVNAKDMRELEKIAGENTGRTIKRKDAERLVNLYNKAFEGKKRMTVSCGSCIAAILDEVKASIQNK